MTEYQVVDVAGVDIGVVEADWGFARDEAEAIERNWRLRTEARPEIFDGRVLLLRDGHLAAMPDGSSVFRGQCFETGFKQFLAWRDFGFRPTGARNCFAMAALESADGAFLLGEMNTHTAPAGQIYFPSGTPDRDDIVGTRLDLDASARRELREETGLDPAMLAFAPGFTLVMSETRLCCMKRVRSPDTAEALVARIHAWLSADPKPELARMHIVRRPADLTPAMPPFMHAFLQTRLASETVRGSLGF